MHWSSISGIIPLCQRFLAGEHLSKPELEMVYLKTTEYRKRLMCISDFMQLLNQYIARQSNIEDRVKGHFYDLRPCKSRYAPPVAFKFDPVKFSGNLVSKAKHCLMKELY